MIVKKGRQKRSSKNKNTQNTPKNNDLQQRALFFSRVLMVLYSRERISGGRIREANRGARHLSLGIRLADPGQLNRALKLGESVALATNVENVLAYRQAGLVIYQFQLRRPFWHYYTRADLPNPQALGLAERRRPILFQFDEARPHTMIAGATGSGKTETIKTALLALLQTFTRDELQLVIVDVFNNYTDFENVANLAIPRATSAADIESALVWCEAELARRVAHNIKDAHRLVVIVDEAERILSTQAAVERIKAIAKTGRQFKVNLILGSQQFKETDLPGVVRELNNRFVGLVNDAQTSSRLTGHAGLQAHKLTGKGDFLHVTGPDVIRFQVAQATPADFAGLERCEITPPETPAPAAVELPIVQTLPPPAERGRPKVELDPAILAHYFYYGPDGITYSQADSLFNLKRTGHILHREAIRQFGRVLLKLRAAGLDKPFYVKG